ncbi:hypothetical protein IEQ34_020486 [Dendrobium chrysotoxum]|uniref:Uncharacterized protein n=1 Tax=Dendrobium chrysotoxum TaxID=161865 RepID=A0AAV7G2G3_DENCH|nr:hypothetical protein IEQ34_020486 [Dendrobium chrysotoxum]
MEEKKSWKIPPFGNWEYFDEMSLSHCFDSASQPGLIRPSFFGDEDLFKLQMAMPVKSAHPYCNHCRRKVQSLALSYCVWKGHVVGVEKPFSTEQQQQKKQGTVCDSTATMPRTRRAPMAVDEDLYKIPPELLHQKPDKRQRVLRNLLWGCMTGLNCIR